MSMYRKEWDCCGDVSETNGWEPETCPFCATTPAPSTAPEVPPFPESFGLADVPHAMNTPDDWDADYRATWQKLQVAEINLSQMRAYARKLRAALASRPAEVDDEDLPLPESKFCAWLQHGRVWNAFPHGVGDKARWDRGGYWSAKGFDREPLFTAEQYRQGQRDAVAADRARRDDVWISVHEKLPPEWEPVLTYGAKRVGQVVMQFSVVEGWQIETASEWHSAYWPTHWKPLGAAPSHTTNKEK